MRLRGILVYEEQLTIYLVCHVVFCVYKLFDNLFLIREGGINMRKHEEIEIFHMDIFVWLFGVNIYSWKYSRDFYDFSGRIS